MCASVNKCSVFDLWPIAGCWINYFCILLQNLGGLTTQQAAGQQQKVVVGVQGSLGSTWSDPSVNISLDFLSAGLNSTKTPPTLNNIIQQQGNILPPSHVTLFCQGLPVFFIHDSLVQKEVLDKRIMTNRPMYLCAGVPPINLLAQNFGGLNLSSPPHVTPIRPQANPMTMGMPATGIPTAMTANMPPSMTTGTVGMGGIPVNQGVMGMNMSMNMGMTTPVMMGGMAGMGVPGVGMGLTHSMAPAMVPPKHDAFANFGSFGKWRSVCLWMWVCVYFIERIVDEWWQCMSDLMRVTTEGLHVFVSTGNSNHDRWRWVRAPSGASCVGSQERRRSKSRESVIITFQWQKDSQIDLFFFSFPLFCLVRYNKFPLHRKNAILNVFQSLHRV